MIKIQLVYHFLLLLSLCTFYNKYKSIWFFQKKNFKNLKIQKVLQKKLHFASLEDVGKSDLNFSTPLHAHFYTFFLPKIGYF